MSDTEIYALEHMHRQWYRRIRNGRTPESLRKLNQAITELREKILMERGI